MKEIELFWSAKVGAFVDKTTGRRMTGATFTGTEREWREVLVEVVIDLTLQAVEQNDGKPINDIELVCDPKVASILHSSVLFKEDPTWPTLGTIGEPVRGVLCRRIPVRGDVNLQRTYQVRLIQKSMSGHRRLGAITVLDMPRYLDESAPQST